MTVQRAQIEAFEVLFLNREADVVLKKLRQWVFKKDQERQSLYLFGTTVTPTSKKHVAVFGFEQLDTEESKIAMIHEDRAYHCVLLRPGSTARKIIAQEIVLMEGIFIEGDDSIEYLQY